ncbi:MAG: MBL fold metallo-hydrolase [Candidatus Latescibacteria bacterium]|nr:MBL fold metallo-hydrolase [Candidatus Latescibacterota bacterium]
MTETTIDVGTLRAWLDRGRPVTVLDIRRPDERAEWSIPGSLHVDAYEALKTHDPDALRHVDLPMDVPVVTVCGAGKTSAIAAEQLRGRGVQALSLTGGMKAWSLAWNSAEVPIPRSEARVIQARRTGKGCLSYLIGAHGTATVIDAALDPQVYLEVAQACGWTITQVMDTHVHADHLSRSRMLAALTGATLYLPDQRRVSYPFTAIRDQDVLTIGASGRTQHGRTQGSPLLTGLHTPGHTLESTCYLLDDRVLFTGDTLFLAGVGRPDLDASSEEARARAHALYHSLQRLLDLPPETLILPGHTSTPIAFDHVPLSATLAAVRTQISALQMPEHTFVETILSRIPPTPPNYHRIVELNETGTLPDGDPADLEAGANRCAVA